MFYKTILVLTDNLIMAENFQRIIEGIQPRPIITYAVSPPSDSIEFSQKLKMDIEKINLNDNSTIDWIKNNFSLVLSIHCKQLFPADLVNSIKCINVHPGLNPYTRGWYPQVFAIINDLPIGATIHEMDDLLDHGGIIARLPVKKEYVDTSLTLYRKVLLAEISLLAEYLPSILAKNYKIIEPEEDGKLYLKKDFKKLCEIKLGQITTTTELINRLRALSHGNFKNSFFINPENGKKIYISVNLTEE